MIVSKGRGVIIIDCFNLKEKVVIVTGGSKGLGRAMAIGMAATGAKIVIASRTKELLEETANEIVQQGGDVLPVVVDVNNFEDIKKMMEIAIGKFGKIDVLINNAGIGPLKKTVDLTVNEWNEVINTNLNSVFILSKTIGQKMIEQKKGKIINISSVLGQMASNTSLHYCTSKAGIIHFTRALALEWSRFNINVNCIAPGFIKTEMIENQLNDEKHINFLLYKIPLRRLGEPEEVVPIAILLASDASNYITGETIFIDGGYSIW